MSARSEQGLTLIEVTIVTVLAAVVVMGLIGFYISSQATWMDGSTQALAQRDGTLLIETISERVHRADHVWIYDHPDPLHRGIQLFDRGNNLMWEFWWDDGDSLVFQGPSSGRPQGPVVASRVTCFQLDTLERLVTMPLIELRAGDGQLVRLASAARLYNRPEPPQ